MDIYNELLNKKTKLSLIGLGYVGLPIAIAYAKKIDVIGFDINKQKIQSYKSGIDITEEVGNQEVENSTMAFTSDEKRLRECKFHIIAVPTPTNNDKTPNLVPIENSTKILGRNLTKGSIIVYESTVYPGVTEGLCIPILEKESGLKCGIDFKVAYSPERINPGDKMHRLNNIVKIVSGMDEETLENVAKVYELVIEAGVYRAESIKVAEAAKLIENCQRDVMIAFVNELSMIFDKLGIDTQEVINAASSKWNYIKMNPGLVGGHCIGVDPYYLIHMAKEMGVESKVMAASRSINDGMAKYVANNTIKNLITANKSIKDSKVAVLGITFKENCPDTRNSKAVDIIDELKKHGLNVMVSDPIADNARLIEEYNLELTPFEDIKDVDAIIITVSHTVYRDMNIEDFSKLYNCNRKLDAMAEDKKNKEKNVLIDVKGILDKNTIDKEKIVYWKL